MSNNITQETMVGYVYNGEAGQEMVKARSITATGGAASSVSMSTLGGSDDDYNGYWLECLSATNARNKGQWRMVEDYTASTGQLAFHDNLPLAAASGDKFQLYSTLGDPLVVATADGDLTTVAASGRPETTVDLWNDYEMICVNGDKVVDDVNQTISGFVPTPIFLFTVDASMAGSMISGDVYQMRRFIQAQGITFTPDNPTIQRPNQRGTFAKTPDIRGGFGGTISMSLELTPSATKGAVGTYPAMTPFDHLLWGGLGGRQIAQSDTVDTLSGTSLTLDGSGSFTTQDAVVLGSEMRWFSDGTTVNEAYQNAYNTDDIAYGSRNYAVSTAGQRHFTFDFHYDGLRYQTFCSKLSALKVVSEQGAIPMLNLEFTVGHYISTDEDTPATSADFTNIDPNPVFGSEFYLNGTSLTFTSVEMDYGFTTAPRANQGSRNGHKGFLTTDVNPTITATVQFEDQEHYHEWDRNAIMDCFWHSTSEGSGVGFWCKVQIDSVSPPTDQDGVYYCTVNLIVKQQTDTTKHPLMLSYS